MEAVRNGNVCYYSGEKSLSKYLKVVTVHLKDANCALFLNNREFKKLRRLL